MDEVVAVTQKGAITIIGKWSRFPVGNDFDGFEFILKVEAILQLAPPNGAPKIKCRTFPPEEVPVSNCWRAKCFRESQLCLMPRLSLKMQFSCPNIKKSS